MKKILGLLVVVFVALGLAMPASADGAIAANEQKILNELNAGATIGGKKFYFEAAEINAAENHLKRVALTDAQVEEVLTNIRAAVALVGAQNVDTTNATTLGDALRLLPTSVLDQLKNYVIAAGNAVGVKITFGSGGSYTAVTVTDAAGNPVYSSGSAVKNTGNSYVLSGITFGSLLAAAAGAAFVSRKRKLA
ncbi:hypothetical protein IW492_08350 [Enterococcus sp. BWB1-3]|uniref:hypothetical protein n=1 Tax=unclassified Enterococcus TaxID=2608891 RepID=UPI001921DD15|nr:MULTISPECIES: hypothetical protein [unclassified Enterococcus]MBL1229242.1 hypothetical protein [Enterococcus sp. BWB1-3]MCB5951732.1 hypothetical protein [Enterococcus sp. BWT-B8]MCB5955785.1 hypothetical protein [Enterococcus sp. CWB-B31]